ncbi:hypothetical protein Tco_1371311 [Tanacetum coccineum]
MTQTTTMPNVDIPLGMIQVPNEPPLPEGHSSRSGEGRMEYTFELMDIVPPTPYDSPLPGGYTPGSDEGRLKLEELMDMQVESFDDDLDEEDASKQGRTSDKTKPISGDTEAVNTTGKGVSTVAPRTPPTTTTVFDDKDVTLAMAQTLIKMKEEKAKEKGVAIKDVEDSSRPIRSITTLQPLPTINPKDKGKGILQENEPVEKTKKKVQELSQRLHEEELAELDKAQKEKQKQEEATNAALAEEFDEIQARIDADHELAVRLTHEEQEKYTIKERATLLAEYFERRKKKLAVERYTHQQLKHKTLEELQKLYQKEQKWINDFKPMDFEEDGSNTKKAGKRIKRITDLTSNQKSPKKSKVIKEQEYAESNEQAASDYEQEKEELRMWFEDNTPEGYNLLLWGDLKRKEYPRSSREMLKKMVLNWKLEVEAESTMAFELLKFIKSHVEE